MTGYRFAIVIMLLVITAAVSAFAAPPRTISHQGYLKDGTGKPVTAATNLTFRLYSSTSAQSGPLWSETRSVTPANGVYSVGLGIGTPLDALPFDVQYFLGVTVESGTELTPRQPLTSAPYAIRAGMANSADSAASATTLGGLSLPNLDSRYIDPTRPMPTAQQLATLRWDQIRGGSGTFAVGTNPAALVFDGSSIWVANYGSNSVMKIDLATGAVSPPITAGSGPRALAFDGSSIWVANMDSNSVVKINPATGVVSPPITVGINPYALAFDGSSIWVANYNSGSVMKIDPTTGAVTQTITAGISPSALAFDGSSIWVANESSNSVMKINPATGVVSRTVIVGTQPSALAFDGSNIWVANTGSNSVMKINPATGVVSPPITIGSGQRAMVFDGSSIWIAIVGSNSVMKIDLATDAVSQPITVGNIPFALAFDGSNIWVANMGSNSVMKMAGAGQAVGVLTVGTSQLIDGAVIGSKIAAGAVTSDKIADGVVTAAKLDTAFVKLAGDTMTGQLNVPSVTVGPWFTGSAASNTFITNAGSLGNTAGNILKLATIGFNANNFTSFGFKARRTANGSDWTTSALGLSFDVDNTSPVNNAQIWMTADGNVGVGTTAPTAKLEVAGGDLKVSGTGSGIVFPDGTVQTTAAAPTWHQILPAAQRFQLVMNNEAVLDRETGLVWARTPDTVARDWYQAQAYCFNMTLGGRKGWRLPSVGELASLIDPTQMNPALPVGNPFLNVQAAWYWSSSTLPYGTDNAWYVDINNGNVSNFTKSLYTYVWPVRSGQ